MLPLCFAFCLGTLFKPLNLVRVRILNRDYWPCILLLCVWLLLFGLVYIILFLIYTLHSSSSICKVAFICHPVVSLFLKGEKLQFTHFGHAMTGFCLWELCLSLWGDMHKQKRNVKILVFSHKQLVSYAVLFFSVRGVAPDLTTVSKCVGRQKMRSIGECLLV